LFLLNSLSAKNQEARSVLPVERENPWYSGENEALVIFQKAAIHAKNNHLLK
jgi:hypothetical protein